METAIERRARLQRELDGLKEQYNRTRDEGLVERMSNLKTGIVRAKEEIVRDAAGNPRNREDGSPPATNRRRDNSPHAEDRERGLRAVDSMRNELSAEAGDRLEDVVRRDAMGIESKYIDAIANPAYESAFGKKLLDPDGARDRFTDAEAAAMRVAHEVTHERALSTGTGSEGGFAVPAALDPSVILTSDGRQNPIRALASVRTISSNVWQGVSTEGVEASWDPEATEVSDDTPVLAQPSITPEKLAIFVPFSIEVGQDWSSLREEMTTLFSDAKDELESEAFTLGVGSGSNRPEGLLVGGTISVSGGGTIVPDYYELQEALPPRYQPRATWLSSNTQQNRAYRAVAAADSDEPPLVSEDRTSILGKSWREVSHMTTTVAGTTVAYGDIASAYRVIDRVGMSVELVPHLFGNSNRPTGQRGLYAYARVGGGVIAPNAVRKLVVS